MKWTQFKKRAKNKANLNRSRKFKIKKTIF